MGKDTDSSRQSFDARLRQARDRNISGRETQGATTQGSDMSVLGFALRAGTEMVSALVVGVAVGWGLDRWLGSRPAFLILFSFLGGAAGVLNVWRLVRPMDTPGDKPDP
ncbi:putative ATP synthase [Gluconacetobacter diazotrophicus PA1 5]|uniref:ATP synthase protein I n=2 Tax=Gluconacetobacter diazotrophicus TaxID=33996 RepID=A9HDN4_GLUDA|nr:AtpZ/AtpI family protein [Gluconacetobacter diazotrophicus]ACI51654.1 putative ATP synthase [Gluconacetobacter diazotrophicus PA1 5]MBB2155314.1 AtpZ/AtpI family protein [Gluconacetobacter diazotrophicus]TWB10998.1 ATP synthase protein I [Gluconacetobacter diazotrophicus]CAP55124.1 putative ATP synthase [Gluconacetobacter diazotrophicus PA1 5]